MKKFDFKEIDLKGAYLISPFYSDDIRGKFIKDFEDSFFKENNINYDIKEIFYSESKIGTIRGLHFQYGKEQSKIVRCIRGKIFDVIVDLRRNSPTYKQWRGFYLDDDNNLSLYIPKGFAHGFMAIEDRSIVSYKCDEEFYPQGDSGIIWNDKDIAINWPIELIGSIDDIIISKKDSQLQSFEMFEGGNRK